MRWPKYPDALRATEADRGGPDEWKKEEEIVRTTFVALSWLSFAAAAFASFTFALLPWLFGGPPTWWVTLAALAAAAAFRFYAWLTRPW